MADTTVSVDCCVVGGGPAGMMLGFLLARFPALRRIPAQLIGIGVRPEHIRTLEFPGA